MIESMPNTMFNSQGKLMLEKKNCTSHEKIDLSAFAGGIYFLNCISIEKSNVVKLIMD